MKYFALAELGIALLAITLVAWMLAVQVEKTIKRDIENSLSTVLNGTHKAISTWASHHLKAAERLSQLDDTRDDAESLLSISTDRNSLLSSAWLQHIREDLEPLVQTNHYKGYFLIGPGNINLASPRDRDIGKPNLLESQSDVLERLWSGKSALSRPMKSDVPMRMQNGMLMDGHPTMFVGAPIKNQTGHVIAVLLLRIDPFDAFFPLTQQGRLGSTGEVYAFDANGLLLTESRFNEQLKNLGFIKEGEHSSLAFEVRDPGVNLLENRQGPSLSTDLPLTKMAARAIRGENGIDLEGHRDFRGVTVVAAWLWDEKFNMGLTVEQGASEAYATLLMMQRIIYGVAAFSVFVLMGLLWSSERGKINRRRTEARLDAVFDNAVDGIVVIDENGVIERVNPALLEMFGFSQLELIGENVRILMPETVSRQHDTYLKRYRETGEQKIIGFGREVEARRKSGQLFPVDLSVSEILVDGERQFAGVIHDISDHVALQTKLNQLNEELSLMALVAQKTDTAVFIADQDWRVIWVNDGFTVMCGYGLEEVVGRRPDDILYSSETDPQTVKNIRERLRAGQKVEEDILNYKKSGEPYWVHIEITPIFDDQGELIEFIALEQDITEQRNMMKELEWAKITAESAVADHAKSEEILRLSLAAAGAGYWFINLGTGVLTLDKRSTEIFGISGEEFVGRYQDWANWVHPDDFPSAQGEFVDALEDMEVSNFILEYRVVWPNGEERYVHVSANIERDLAGLPTSVYGLYFDETDRIHNEKTLNEAKEEAEAANIAKSSFLATMSHEIRTPMNGVVGMTDVLSESGLNSTQQDMANTIKSSAISLLGIIDDILDFSKIEAGKLSLERLPVSIQEVVEGVGDTLLPVSIKNGIELAVYCDPKIPALVYADPVRLGQILFNLAGNAIKFTNTDSIKTGRVMVHAELVNQTAEQVAVFLQVEDNGIGMSMEAQEHLFQPFSQAEESTTRRFGGTGLGLSICRRLVDMMGGRIEVASQEGLGSTFSVYLSLEIAPTETQKNDLHLDDLCVLLVGCEGVTPTIIEAYLQTAGAETTKVNDTDQIVEIVQELSPAKGNLIVVIDHHQRSTGIDNSLRQQLRETLADYEPKFVMIARGSRQHPRQDGHDGYSIDFNAMHRKHFLTAVAAAAGRASLVTDSNKKPPIQVTAPSSLRDAEAAGQLILVAEDNETNQKVLLQQLSLLGYMAEVAVDGRNALEKWRSGAYGLLLTDCHMPEMDGYELAHSIRQEEEEGKHIPIIAITADALKDARQKCLASGMDDYLSKPVQLNHLRDKLTQWLTDSSSEHSSSTEEAKDEENSTAVVNPDVLKEILGVDDPAMLADFYADFIRTSEETIEALIAAQNVHNAEEVGALGHRMKSSARAVGANDLADCCLALEMAGKAEDWESINTQLENLPAHFQAVNDWVNQQNN